MNVNFVELEDWELLHSSDSNSVEEIKGFEVVNDDSKVLIRSDYFDSRSEYLKTTGDVIVESSGAQSPKRVVQNICSDDGLVDDFEGSNEVGFVEKSEIDLGFNGVEEIVVGDLGIVENEKTGVGFPEKGGIEVGFDGIEELVVGDLGFAENEKTEVGFLEKGKMVEEIVVRDLGIAENGKFEVGLVGGVDEGEDSNKFMSNSIGSEGNTEMSDGANSNFRDGLVLGGGEEGDKRCDDVDIVSGERESGGEGEKRIMVWWKLPFEFLKYCIIRTSPVWTVSMAAAVMGFVILGRRYYSMKRKSRSVQVKVTMDDKKLSQFKSRVVQLNEAFSVVKSVPIIRHSLPAASVTPHGLR